MPGPDEVLAFEMPPLVFANGEPALPDQWSLRVRIGPAEQRY